MREMKWTFKLATVLQSADIEYSSGVQHPYIVLSHRDRLSDFSVYSTHTELNSFTHCIAMTEKSYTTTSAFPALTPGKMRIYSMRFCPFAERARLVLAHKNIEHETVNINLKQKPSWFLDRNPNGTVPVIEQDDKVLYESLVCADYLDEVYPNNKLTPSDPYRRAQDRIIVELFSKVMGPFYKISYGNDVPKDAITGFHAAIDPVEKALAERGTPFFGGSSVQMVDLMMWPLTERFGAMAQLVKEASVTADRYPKFTKWIENMGKVPAVQKCRWDTSTHVHFIETAKAGKPDYDFGL